MEIYFDQYVISDDPSKLNVDMIYAFLSQSYWAHERNRAAMEKSFEHSICYGVYHESKQIGFARIVTDYATMYYLADVFIIDGYRGKGIGKKLVDTIVHLEDYEHLKGLLATKDAHQLYEQFGFVRDETSYMKRAPK